ncbi:uncharacterized protein LOC120267013 [Dioscorea cayenensis subsp. rotundata]|uniref:Uncharacterized protein LOC120267013 n=1 Tax=Dioscorea cayennensis subsp. rotundata TaxID=55577 RepID=A0AB40BT65_DIOCR|nr:uncharacterized protein LOC120267013 [Dioscorea cayenensis subsp. rotundata]
MRCGSIFAFSGNENFLMNLPALLSIRRDLGERKRKKKKVDKRNQFFVVVSVLVHQMWNPNKSLNAIPHLLHLSLLINLQVSAEVHGKPANEIVDIINQNRTSNKLPKLYDSAGLGCMALQYISECTVGEWVASCSQRASSKCTIEDVFWPNEEKSFNANTPGDYICP